jgi:hypothetical protein
MSLYNKQIDVFDFIFLILIIQQFFNPVFLFPQECDAELKIKTNLPNSLIYIDNKFTGTGNIKIEVSKGIHFIFIKENKLIWNADEIKDTIKIADCTGKEFIYRFKEKYFISGVPQDAGVFVNDSLIGYTPISIASSISEIKLKHKDYLGKELYLKDYLSGENFKLTGGLKPVNKNFLNSDFFKLLVGSAIIFGGTAAYFKLKADDNFDEYNSTNIQRFLDNTRKYDLISGIAFGALQINFAALIYFFLVD